jgi:hypothetical protein
MGWFSWIDWVCVVGGSVALVLGFGVLVRWVRGDPAKGRRRCPRCWYDMQGQAGLTCSECGRTAKDESKLRRTRRRVGRLAAGLALVIAAAGLGTRPWVARGAVVALASTGVLAAVLAYWPERGVVGDELERRLGVKPWPNGELAASLDEDELISFIERVKRGMPGARVGDDRWERTYGVVWDRLRDSSYGGTSVSERFVRISTRLYFTKVHDAFVSMAWILPVSGLEIRVKSEVPVGFGVPVQVKYQHRGPRWVRSITRMEWMVAGATKKKTEEFDTSGWLAIRDAGEHDLLARVSMIFPEVQRNESSVAAVELGNVRERIVVSDSASSALPRVKIGDLEKWLATFIEIRGTLPYLDVRPPEPVDPAYHDCAFAMKYEAHAGEVVVARGSVRWLGLRGLNYEQAASRVGIVDLSHSQIQEAVAANGGGVRIVFKSDELGSFEMFDAAQVWDGKFVVNWKP